MLGCYCFVGGWLLLYLVLIWCLVVGFRLVFCGYGVCFWFAPLLLVFDCVLSVFISSG